MTLQQEAINKVSGLSEDGLRLIIALADEIENQGMFMNAKESDKREEDRLWELKRKQTAFAKMEALRKESSFPKDFDYEKPERGQ